MPCWNISKSPVETNICLTAQLAAHQPVKGLDGAEALF